MAFLNKVSKSISLYRGESEKHIRKYILSMEVQSSLRLMTTATVDRLRFGFIQTNI